VHEFVRVEEVIFNEPKYVTCKPVEAVPVYDGVIEVAACSISLVKCGCVCVLSKNTTVGVWMYLCFDERYHSWRV
jgi:hypothetical protein